MKSLNNKKENKTSFSLNTTVLIFLIVVIKYSDKGNLRKKLAHSSQENNPLWWGRRSRQKELQVYGGSAAMIQRVMTVCSCSAPFLHVHSLGSRAGNEDAHSGQVFSHHQDHPHRHAQRPSSQTIVASLKLRTLFH